MLLQVEEVLWWLGYTSVTFWTDRANVPVRAKKRAARDGKHCIMPQ
jgi:hypothetical protein